MSALLDALEATKLEELRNLEREIGRDFLSGLIELYLDSAPKHLEDLARSMRESDARAAEETAHSLKGSSGALAALSLSALCGELEHRASENDLAAADGLIQNLRDEFERVESALRRVLEES